MTEHGGLAFNSAAGSAAPDLGVNALAQDFAVGRSVARRNALARFAEPSLQDRRNALGRRAAGAPEAAPDLGDPWLAVEQGLRDAARLLRELDPEERRRAADAAARIGQIASTVLEAPPERQAPLYTAALEGLEAAGIDTSGFPSIVDRIFLPFLRNQALKAQTIAAELNAPGLLPALDGPAAGRAAGLEALGVAEPGASGVVLLGPAPAAGSQTFRELSDTSVSGIDGTPVSGPAAIGGRNETNPPLNPGTVDASVDVATSEPEEPQGVGFRTMGPGAVGGGDFQDPGPKSELGQRARDALVHGIPDDSELPELPDAIFVTNERGEKELVQIKARLGFSTGATFGKFGRFFNRNQLARGMMVAEMLGATIEFDEDGKLIAAFPGGERFFVNKPEFSPQDFTDLPPFGPLSVPVVLVARALNDAAGPLRESIEAFAERGGEGLAQADPKVRSLLVSFVSSPAFYDAETRRLTEPGRAALADAGIDPQLFTPNFVADLERTAKSLADAERQPGTGRAKPGLTALVDPESLKAARAEALRRASAMDEPMAAP